MAELENVNYQRIAQAIDYIQQHFTNQPSLNDIAGHIGISPFHFQRLFTEWAGVSPKKFIQYLSINHAKQLLKNQQLSLLDTAHQTGLSGTGRLHDLFVGIEAMTPGEFKNGGEQLTIQYSFAESPFGKVIVASTEKGLCHMFFEQSESRALANLQQRFPKARFRAGVDAFQQAALGVFENNGKQLEQIKLHLKASVFQLQVWQALLRVPEGRLTAYGNIANQLGNPKASRAVGTAIGSNPIAFLIPCHRVIQNSGKLGGYRWGNTRKLAIIGWEAAKVDCE